MYSESNGPPPPTVVHRLAVAPEARVRAPFACTRWLISSSMVPSLLIFPPNRMHNFSSVWSNTIQAALAVNEHASTPHVPSMT